MLTSCFHYVQSTLSIFLNFIFSQLLHLFPQRTSKQRHLLFLYFSPLIVLDCFFLFNLYIYKSFLLASSFLLSFQPPFILPFTLLYTFYRLSLNLSLTLLSRYYVRHACIPLELISFYYHPFFPPCCHLLPSIPYLIPTCLRPSICPLYSTTWPPFPYLFLLRFSLIFFFTLTIFCTYLYQISIPLHFPCIFFLSFYFFYPAHISLPFHNFHCSILPFSKNKTQLSNREIIYI